MSFIKTMIDQLAKSRLRITLYAIPLRLVNSPSGICVFRASRSSLRCGRRWTSAHWTLSAPQSCQLSGFKDNDIEEYQELFYQSNLP